MEDSANKLAGAGVAAADPGSPIFIGTNGDDQLVGTSGDDQFQGMAGADSLLGGEGIDIALYPGAASGYRIESPRVGRWIVTDIAPADGDEGRDTLDDVEKLRFADGDLQLSDVGEFQVNSWTRDFQGDAAVAAMPAGGWLAVWSSYGQDGDGMGIFGQRFGSDGLPAGAELRLNAVPTGEQRDASVIALAGGGFVAVWSSGEPGVSLRLTGRRFADDGTALGGEFAVDASFAGYQTVPAIAAGAGGGFTVVWQSTINGIAHITARRFGADGASLGDAFQVDASSPPPEWGAAPSIAATAAGFVVAWQSDPLDGQGDRTVVRRLSAEGGTVGAEIPVGTRDFGAQTSPEVATLADGGFVVAWHATGAQDAVGAIFAQRFDATGSARGAATRVSDPDEAPYGEPSIAGLSDGGFVVSWIGPSSDAADVLARRYRADGTASGAPFLVDTVTDGQQWTPAVTGLADGGYVIAWRSDGLDSALAGEWGTGGVFAQRYSAEGDAVAALPPSRATGSAIDDVLVGTGQQDQLLGLDGDDALTGAGGDDRIDGGAGDDEARFAGPMGDFVFSNTVADRFDIADTVAGNGDEGRDALIDIERVRFADGEVSVAQLDEFTLASGGTSAQFPGATGASLARLADGRLVAAWTGSDGSRGGVYAQLLAADATPLAQVFKVNATTWLAQTSPSVAPLPDGGFIVAWDSEQDGSESGIYAQRYLSSGAPAGGEFRVNTYTHSDQLGPEIAAQGSGALLVAWNSLDQDGSGYGIYGQRLGADGLPAGAEFRISETSAENQVRPALARLADGTYVVAWMSALAGPAFDADVYLRRYGADGTALGGEVWVNSYSTLDQGYPTVAALAGGGFVVVWHSQGQDGDGYGVYGQRFSAAGAAVGAEFRINTTTAEPQSVPTVAALADGGFFVAWSSGYYYIGETHEYDTDLYGRRFASDGSPAGEEFRINSYDAQDQGEAAIVGLADGGLLVAWNSVGGTEVRARRFDAAGREINELTVTGGAGGDTLRGGEGTQILAGGAGDDVYEADLAQDQVVELPGEGRDTLWSSGSATLPATVENLMLAGDADADGTGNAADNALAGNGADNRLYGLAGNDWLAGGGGDDLLDGGEGSDTAAFAAAAGVHTVARIGDGWRVALTNDAAGGATLASIEFLRFADKAFELVNPPRTGVPAFGASNGFLFDAVFYLLDNPELVPEQTPATALQHYFATGAALGKAPSSWFDASYYENRWSDLNAGGFDDATLFMHYNLYGVWEGRSAGPDFDQFDGSRYLTDNPDVAAYVDGHLADFLGSRSNGAIAHYVIYGSLEQRPAFDLSGQAIAPDYVLDLAS